MIEFKASPSTDLVRYIIFASPLTSNFVASSSVSGGGVCRRHTLYSGQYLKSGLSDLIQIWHVDVTGPQGVLYSFVTLNSH